MDAEKNLLLEPLRSAECRSTFENLIKSRARRGSVKSAERSERIRQEGNKLYSSQRDLDAEDYIEIFRHYCQSVSLAPLDSEILAKAYANRSALLLRINRYEDCIKDCDRALKITKSDLLKIKLLCRTAECMKKLASPDCQSVLETAEDLAGKVDETNKAQIDRLIDKVKACSIVDQRCSRRESNQNNVLSRLDPPLDCVSIEYNEKYGRCLIAKRDYNPGDFIFRDDLYVTLLNQEMSHTNCNNCLKICWSGVACDHCDWAMFCSQQCKEEAWNNFHDVECSLLPFVSRLVFFDAVRVGLRVLLVGIREVGSIEKLREELTLVDRSTDNRCKGFYKNGQFAGNTIQSIYSLRGRDFSKIDAAAQFAQDAPAQLARDAAVALISIAKQGQLIKDIKLDNVDDVITNEDLTFLGSLLIKFTLISMNNIFSFSQMNRDCNRLKRTDGKCCDRGNGLGTLSSLLNHSCNPNAARIFTEDRKINIFALQPIKKNSQIFITYAAFYYNKSPNDRELTLWDYNVTCDCEACIENWPPLFLCPYEEATAGQSIFERKMQNHCKDIFDALDVKQINFTNKDVKKLCKTIVQAKKRLSGPTYLMAALEDSLLLIYSRIYGWKSPIHEFGK